MTVVGRSVSLRLIQTPELQKVKKNFAYHILISISACIDKYYNKEIALYPCMGPVCEQGKRDEHHETLATQSSTDELFWMISKSLTGASNSCNDSVAQINLVQYQAEGGDADLLDDADERNFASVQSSLERSVEDLELAIAALEELQRRATDKDWRRNRACLRADSGSQVALAGAHVSECWPSRSFESRSASKSVCSSAYADWFSAATLPFAVIS